MKKRTASMILALIVLAFSASCSNDIPESVSEPEQFTDSVTDDGQQVVPQSEQPEQSEDIAFLEEPPYHATIEYGYPDAIISHEGPYMLTSAFQVRITGLTELLWSGHSMHMMPHTRR